jgi:hypothetical protein
MTSSHTRRRGPVLALATLLALGTASAEGKEQYLYLRTSRSAHSARITSDSVSSPYLRLSRDGKTLRGRAFGRVVFLGLNGQELGGTVGRVLTRMSFEEVDGVLQARGSFYGRPAELNLSAESLTGTLGSCSYELTVTRDGDYQGTRSCGDRPARPLLLAIPPALARQGPAMTLATLALMLGSDPEGPQARKAEPRRRRAGTSRGGRR